MSDDYLFLERIIKEYDLPTLTDQLLPDSIISIEDLEDNFDILVNDELTNVDLSNQISTNELINNNFEEHKTNPYEILHSGWYAENLKNIVMDFDTSVEKAKLIESGLFAQEKLSNREFSVFRESDLKLISELGRDSYHEFVLNNLKLCRHISFQFANTRNKMDVEDIFSSSLFGLIRAVQKWDWTKGYMFSTYATHWIRQTIQRGIDDESNIVRIPVHLMQRIKKNKDFNLWKFKDSSELLIEEDNELFQLLNFFSWDDFETLDSFPMSEFSDLGDMDFDQRLQVGFDFLLSSEDEAEESQVQVFYEDETLETLIDGMANQILIKQIFSSLNEKEKSIICLRFGINDGRELTLDEIGQIFGVTRERVRQIESKSLNKMKQFILQSYFEIFALDRFIQSKYNEDIQKVIKSHIFKDQIFSKSTSKLFNRYSELEPALNTMLSRIFELFVNPS